MNTESRTVLLLRPRSRAFSTFPPLGLMALAASLEPAGYTPLILDLCFDEDVARLQTIMHGPAPLVVGITATTPEFGAVPGLVAQLKTRWPGTTVVLGGIHATALGVHALREAGADIAVLGEGEETLVQVCDMLSSGSGVDELESVAGLLARDGTSTEQPIPRPPLDVALLPDPSWRHMNAERYFSRRFGILQKRKRIACLITSRGCGHACSFCASPGTLGVRFRPRTPEAVVDEMQHLNHRFGVEEFLIAEDNFSHNPDRAALICEEILRRRMDIAWRTPNGVRVESLHTELVTLMRRSGCFLLGFGIETANTDLLSSHGKATTLEQVTRAIEMVNAAGIMTFGTFIIGFPEEKAASIRETIRFASASKLDIAHFGLYAPYPGSRDFEKYRDMPGARDWDRYLAFEAPVTFEMPQDELKALMRRAYISFYFHPRRANLYARMLRPSAIWEGLRAFSRYTT